MAQNSREVFFRPEELSRTAKLLSPQIFNLCQLLLNQSTRPFTIVPLRAMQYLSIISRSEIIFIDGNGRYHSRGEFTGRCIGYAWQFTSNSPRTSICESVDYDFVRYCDERSSDEYRLVTEFSRDADSQLKKNYREKYQNWQCEIIPLKQ